MNLVVDHRDIPKMIPCLSSMWDPSGPVQSGSPAATDFELGVTELDTNPDDRSGWWHCQAVWDGVQQYSRAGRAVLYALGVCSSEPRHGQYMHSVGVQHGTWAYMGKAMHVGRTLKKTSRLPTAGTAAAGLCNRQIADK